MCSGDGDGALQRNEAEATASSSNAAGGDGMSRGGLNATMMTHQHGGSGAAVHSGNGDVRRRSSAAWRAIPDELSTRRECSSVQRNSTAKISGNLNCSEKSVNTRFREDTTGYNFPIELFFRFPTIFEKIRSEF